MTANVADGTEGELKRAMAISNSLRAIAGPILATQIFAFFGDDAEYRPSCSVFSAHAGLADGGRAAGTDALPTTRYELEW
jgi:hypothetical protein